MNATVLAEGKLPAGVNLYGPGWKSEYDIDDGDHDYRLDKREQLVSLKRAPPKRYRTFDLASHVLPVDDFKRIFCQHDNREQLILEVAVPSFRRASAGIYDAVQAIGFGVNVTALVFLVVVVARLFVQGRRGQR